LIILITMSGTKPSPLERNEAIRDRSLAAAAQAEAQQSWLERKLKPKKVSARYPFKGAPLLYATCAFGSLGDALFGYNSGMSNQNKLVIRTVTDLQ
jgi:hypothetical protein